MNKNKKTGTIYQQLNQLLNLDGFANQDNNTIIQPEEKEKIIIKGNSPEEIQRRGLELEQKTALQDKFFRSTDRSYQKALQYEAGRLQAYIDYEGFEYYPIISSALDLFMEEATTIGPNGKMLNIYSNKDRIKYFLEELFEDIINVNTNLPFWIRNLCKYGNNFILLYGERKSGLTHVKQMVNYDIERFDRIVNGKPTIKFKDRMTGDDFNVFEMAHFRLLGNDKFLPYGSSILDKIRRTTRQLIMAEDAMLTYRLIRAGEKKVFKIDVGNIDEDDIEDYIYKVATKFKKSSQVNPNNGQFDHRFNILGNDEDYFLPVRNANTQTGIETLPGACLALDTKIDLLDGKSLTLFEIISEFNRGKKLWSYSINPITGEILPAPITWAGVTRKNTEVLKITLDNGKTIICTPDHKFPTKFNGEKQAKDLNIEEIIWSTNKKTKIIKNNKFDLVYDVSKEKYVYIHKLISNYYNQSNEFFNKKLKNENNELEYLYDYNYKVISIEYLDEKQDTGTITIDGNEKYHNFHNFALSCGIFTKNSNLDQIQDIEYLRDNLFMGLGIPKPFLSFQDAAGGGKNLAQFDIRFQKKVNRIQQAAIQELNKMAMIHLYLLGYSGSDLTDFTLTLSNPSTQQELLKAELMREKGQTYAELTRSESGIAPMSHTSAKRLIFNMSDREIVEDLKMQKMERTIAQELQDSPVIIKKTGLFTDIDDKYGEPIEGLPINTETGGESNIQGGGINNTPELGGVPETNVPPTNIETNTLPTGGNENAPVESRLRKKSLLTEKEYIDIVEKLVYGENKTDLNKNKKKIINENDSINNELNDNAEKMITEIDNLLKDSKGLNLQIDLEEEIDNINLDELEDIDIND